MLVRTHEYMSIFETMNEEDNIMLPNYEECLQFLAFTPIKHLISIKSQQYYVFS